ncbi:MULTISPECIES: hypothetical protein [Chryseobacterium]|jgi:hypothetical protein|uniref:Uncharacterized protein n=2 Tax=Chryseobacterium TaxID=59732 RepID=A0A124F2Y2_9FLAO|nr:MULTISPECIES: hypothetical protein [Chryseobacterium]KUJ56216.1 hypothetical protein AR686_06480 [Chryseobacterium aquaticum subsp. greenlandense]QQV01797.1 hypothetical protein I6I61_11950 [Chryseobacterium sp. FDAARGOS 1104]VFB04991.1 Uncharacterised protein [Chryseobacterium taihuense]
MNATKNNIGKDKTTRRPATTKVTSTTSRFRKLASKTKNFKRNSERQTEICTDSTASNGFLKCKFLPKQEEVEIFQDCIDIIKIERDFYKSLSKFSSLYNLNPMQTRDFDYPYNIALAIWDIADIMKRQNEDWSNFKLILGNDKIQFAKEETYDVGTTLFFIPVLPLFQMLSNKKLKQNTELLLSVYCYLYKVGDVPFYRQENSYLYWIYDMHEELLTQDDENEEDLREYKREFLISKSIGNKIEQKISNIKNLEFFNHRLNNFKVKNEFDRDCQKIASDAFALYLQYPTKTVFTNKPSSEENPYDDDYCNTAIGMEKYISFVPDTKGSLYRNIEESINAEFNEFGSIEEPTIYTPINGKNIITADFDFENRFFSLIENLHDLLTT